MDPTLFFALAALLSLVYAYWNGANDCANTIATLVETYALPAHAAVWLASIANACGLIVAYILGSAVAKTIGKGIILPEFITQQVVLGGLIGVIAWAWCATSRGVPVSITHSLFGGVLGAGIAAGGFAAVSDKTKVFPLFGEMPLFWVIMLGIVFAPLIGFIAAYSVRKFLVLITLPFTLLRFTVNRICRKGQVLAGIWLSVSHGMNDGQNAVGILALAYFAAGWSGTIEIKLWMVLAVAAAIGLGTALHGWKVIKKAGGEIVPDLEPEDGFAAQVANAGTIMVKSLYGIPVSTTHVAMSTIAGAGGEKGFREVDWMVSRDIVMAWIITIPAAGSAGALACLLLSLFFA